MRIRTDRHPADGTLRRLLDEPAGVPDADRQHVAGCPACRSGLDVVRRDAASAARALSAPPAPSDLDAAWQRFSTAAARDGATVRPPAPVRHRRRILRRPLVAAVGVVLALGGAGAAAAGDWLPIFHTEHVAAVEIRTSDLVALPDLSAYGDLQMVSQPDVHPVADAAAAHAASGLDVPQVGTLPAGVTGRPQYLVGGQVVAEFTFSLDRAAAAASAAGEPSPTPPPGLDGSRFRLVAGPGVAETWSEARGIPALVVARVTAPTAFSSGVPFATARDYLLSLPGLPASLAAQLRDFDPDGTTLPLPVPADLVRSSTADVHGAQATVLTSRDGSMAGVVWVRDGVVTGIAGTLDGDELLTVARGLR